MHAESDVDVSLPLQREMNVHTTLWEKETSPRVTGSFVNDRRGSPAANKYEVKSQCQQLCKSYLFLSIALASFDYQFYVCLLEFERVAARISPFVFGARQTCCLQARGAAPMAFLNSWYMCPCSPRATSAVNLSDKSRLMQFPIYLIWAGLFFV